MAWHLAHQYRRQMPPDLLAGIDANTRNKIVFTLEQTDAQAFASGSDLLPEDFSSLPPYGIYASLLSKGRQTGWMSGRTLPPPATISDPEEIIHESQARYGGDPAVTTEQGATTGLGTSGDFGGESFGRTPRGAES